MESHRRRVSVVVLHRGKLLAFRAEDPTTRRQYFFIPGGRIEAGETVEQAALRETLEETGYRISCLGNPTENIERIYDFMWDGQLNICETTYVAGELLDDTAALVDDESYHRGVEWIPVDDLPTVFNYHKDILEPVLLLTEYMLHRPKTLDSAQE